jgi:uncharacterized protein YjbK
MLLDVGRFKDKETGIENFLKLIKSKASSLPKGKERMQLMIDKYPQENKKVWYLDTENNELYKNNLLLRVKKENGKEKINLTLKCRNPDRYVAASYDLQPDNKPYIKDPEFEFEEDIVPKFNSIYSTSAKCKVDKNQDLQSMGSLVSIFPGLKALDISKENKLKKVNKFEALEIKKEIGRMFFPNLNNFIEMSLDLWYLPDENREIGNPVIGEFAFDYKSKDFESPNTNNYNQNGKSAILEDFPLSLVNIANSFFSSLQEDEFMNQDKKVKTKTEFAYWYTKHQKS